MTSVKHAIPDELLSALLADYKKPEDLIGENGLLKQLTKAVVERALRRPPSFSSTGLWSPGLI